MKAFLVFAKKRNKDGLMVHAKIQKTKTQEIRQGNCDGLVGWCGKKVAI